MSADNLALVSFHLVMFQKDCLAWSPFLLQAGIHMEILLEKHWEAFAVWEAISARTPCLLHSLSASQRPCIPPSVSAVQREVGRAKLDLSGWRTHWRAPLWSPWMGEGITWDDTPLGAQVTDWTLTESKQGLFLGGNVSQGWSLGGCRHQPQGAGWGPGSGTQNESDASGHLSSVGQRASSFKS